ncbi:MAG: hypothetical protein P1U56_00605 [Saprospiraceae bacterium]|nr:hypothetical protein [Saprospiraceae bacterium]
MHWIDFISNNQSFKYEIEIPVTSVDFKDKILDFDENILRLGKLYGILFFEKIKFVDYNNFIAKYLEERRKCFISNKSYYLKLLDLFQWEYFLSNDLNKHRRILIPELNAENSETKMVSSNLELVDIDYLRAIEYTEINVDFFWSDRLQISFSSNSNIWFDEIFRTKKNNEVGYTLLDIPLNNRVVSYQITPRFNSFFRGVKKTVDSLGGKITLYDHVNQVRSDGILLDGKIIYQEDIDEGRVKLPEFNHSD